MKYKKNINIKIKLNSQMDNVVFKNLNSSAQCGYTSCAMLLSILIPEAKKDNFIFEMISTFEKSFLDGKDRRFGTSLANYQKIVDYYLKKFNLNLKSNFVSNGYKLENVISILESGSALMVPVMTTKFGHFIIINGYNFKKNSYIVKDPFGKFDFVKKVYLDTNGFQGLYQGNELDIYMEKSSKTVSPKFFGIRCLYFEKT